MDYAEARIGKSAFARLSENEDLLDTVTQVAMKTRIHAGFFILIGTLKSAKLGFFREGNYEIVEMKQPLEIISCLGNMSTKEGKVFAHAHVAVSDEKGRAFGGHVMPGCIIGVTGELVLIETSGIQLSRKLDRRTKLSLLSFKSSAKAMKKKPTRRAV
jgi:predicted DNA-binding protein with PD1-like motif